MLGSVADCQSMSLAGSTWGTRLMARELLDRPFGKYARFCRTASFLSHRRIIRSCAFLCATPPRRLCVQNSQAQAPRFFRAYLSGQLRRDITSSPTGLDWLLRARGLGGARLTAQQTRNPNKCLKPSHLLNESIGVTWSAGRYFFFSNVPGRSPGR